MVCIKRQHINYKRIYKENQWPFDISKYVRYEWKLE